MYIVTISIKLPVALTSKDGSRVPSGKKWNDPLWPYNRVASFVEEAEHKPDDEG